MLFSWLEQALRYFSATGTANFFLTVIFFSLLAALWLTHRGIATRFTTYVPTLLTSLGILGTFVGVVIGLLDFEPERLEDSIPTLLAGLQTAFITSVVGLFASIVFKVMTTTPWFSPSSEGAAADVQPSDLLAALNDQTQLLEATREAVAGTEESSLAGQLKLMRTDLADRRREQADAMRAMIESLWMRLDRHGELLQNMKDAIAGGEESSLNGQIKLLRQDLAARRQEEAEAREALAEELWARLDKVAEVLSRAATETIIEALKEVIVDFNRNLTEQFGENFKALDASVQRLVEWQKGYREQLIQLHALYEASVANIANIEATVSKIADSTAAIPESMGQLDAIIQTATHQLDELERHLSAFAELRDRAVEALPQTQAHIETLTGEITASVNAATEHHRTLLDNTVRAAEAHAERTQETVDAAARSAEQSQTDMSRQVALALDTATEHHQRLLDKSATYVDAHDERAKGMIETLTRAAEQTQRETASQQKLVADALAQMREQVAATIQTTLDTQATATQQAMNTMLEQTGTASRGTGEAVQRQLTALDEALQAELVRVMQGMANALARISRAFTEDYERLTEAMARIVNRSRNL